MQTELVVCLFIVVCVNCFLIVSQLMKQDKFSSICLVVLTQTLGIYGIGFAIQVLGNSAELIMVALRIENAALSLLGPLFLLTVFSIYQSKYLKLWMPGVVILYGFLFFILVLTHPLHLLYFDSIHVALGKDGWTMISRYGVFGIIQQVVNVASFVAAYGFVAYAYVSPGHMQRSNLWRSFMGLNIVAVGLVVNLVNGFKPDHGFFILSICIGTTCLIWDAIRNYLQGSISEITYVAVESMEDGMIALDDEWHYQFSNRSAKVLFPALWKYSPMEDVTRKQDWPKELNRRTKPGTVSFKQKDNVGMLQYYRASIQMIENQGGAHIGWSIVIRNVTDVTVMINQMEVLATTDPLTGIYNRRSFFEQVKQEMDRAKRYPMSMSLILYDLDYFKAINDTYGHMLGDMVLCTVVDTVKNQLRPYDIFARYGGEEFVIFTTSNEELDLHQFTDRIRRAIENMEIVHNKKRIQVTASFGAIRVLPHESIDRAFASVDNALYKAKGEGRNRVVICEQQEE